MAIKKKNLQKIGNVTLVGHAIIAALNSQLVDRVVLSTDSIEVANELNPYVTADDTIFRRPQVNKLNYLGAKGHIQILIHWRRLSDATPMSPTIDSVRNYLDLELQVPKLHQSKHLMLLQPTSPFRTAEEVDHVITLFHTEPTLPLASVKEIQSPHPLKTFRLGSDSHAIFTVDDVEKLTSPRQKLEKFYAFDGAYYVNSTENIRSTNALIGSNTRTFLRSGDKTINIDSPDDLLLASLVFKHQRLT